jgi:hypothetical protein
MQGEDPYKMWFLDVFVVGLMVVRSSCYFVLQELLFSFPFYLPLQEKKTLLLQLTSEVFFHFIW